MRRLDALPVALLKYYSCQRMSGEEDSQALTPSQVQRAMEAIEFPSNLPFRVNVQDTGKLFTSCINFTVTTNKITSTGDMLPA